MSYSHEALVSLLTNLDRKEETTERRLRLRVNIYRIGHYLGAAQEVRDAVASGARPADAFADAFTPTRGMHAIARALGLGLEVERGQWVTR